MNNVQKHKYRGGIILTEELLGILLAIIIVAATVIGAKSFIDTGKRDRAMSEAATLGGLVSQYELEVGEYPKKLEDLEGTKGQYGPWIRDVPKDPWGNEYEYQAEKKKGYIIFSKGADGSASSSQDSGIKDDDVGFIGK